VRFLHPITHAREAEGETWMEDLLQAPGRLSMFRMFRVGNDAQSVSRSPVTLSPVGRSRPGSGC